MRKIFILAVIISFCCIGYSQNIQKTDSLILELKKAEADTQKVNILLRLSEQNLSNNPKKSLKYATLALNLAQKLNYKQGIAACYNDLGIHYFYKGDYNKALDYYFNSMKIREELNDKHALATIYNNIGASYNSLANYTSALEYYLKALKIEESTNNKSGMARCYNNIGIIYYVNENYEKTFDYFLKSAKIKEELADSSGLSSSYNNIGELFRQQKKLTKSLEFFNKSLKIAEDLKDLRSIAQATLNIGLCYKDLGNNILAREYFNKSLNIKSDINDMHGFGLALINIAVTYKEEKDYKRAEIEYKKAVEAAKYLNSYDFLKDIYKDLSEIYEINGDLNNSLHYFKLYSASKDSIIKLQSSEKFAELQTQFETEQKEKEIALQKAELKNQKTEIKRKELQQFIMYGTIIFILVILGLSIYYYLQKNKKNKILTEKNIEINQKNEEISAQRDEIESQRNLVTQQKESIEEIHKGVTDSINYAKRIQEAVLPISIKARVVLGQHFILFKPKDIVSGDFYFATKVNEWTLVSVADCTGHGVPGAFMSMLGISFLNEIVRKKEITKANLVLNELRSEIINALQQKGDEGEQKDGMDISLVAINFETLELQFAGANNPLYIVTQSVGLLLNEVSQVKTPDRGSGADFQNFKNLENLDDPTNQQLASANNEPQTTNHKLFELKPDKMPIGIHEIMNNFTNHEIQLNIGDIIYLFSDGYADQFGGQKDKKFMYKQFKELILANCQKSMSEQKDFFDTTIENWISGNDEKFEQTDDITVVGIKI